MTTGDIERGEFQGETRARLDGLEHMLPKLWEKLSDIDRKLDARLDSHATRIQSLEMKLAQGKAFLSGGKAAVFAAGAVVVEIVRLASEWLMMRPHK